MSELFENRCCLFFFDGTIIMNHPTKQPEPNGKRSDSKYAKKPL